MAQPLSVALPPNLVLADGAIISVQALNPTTGALVTGVDVQNVTIEVDLLSGEPAALEQGPFLLVPGPRG